MPAEWEPHRATWIAWPHHEPDWPGKLGAIPWVYAEIARVLANHEQVEILCHDGSVMAAAQAALDAHGVRAARMRLHIVPTDRVWLRDSAPTAAIDDDGPRGARELGVQRLGEMRQLATGRARRRRNRAGDGAAASRAAAAGRASGLCSRGRHRGQRRRPDARHRRMAAQRRAGSESGNDACRLRARVRRMARCGTGRFGSAKDALATIRTGMSTTWPGSSRQTRSCSPSSKTRSTRITRARSTT